MEADLVPQDPRCRCPGDDEVDTQHERRRAQPARAGQCRQGSSHSTYQGNTQPRVTSSATVTQPLALTASRRRQASTQQNSTEHTSTPLSSARSVSVSPPLPSARPSRFGTLTSVTSRLWVLRSGTCKPKANRLAAATAEADTAMPRITCVTRRGALSRAASTTGIRTAPEALIAAAVTKRHTRADLQRRERPQPSEQPFALATVVGGLVGRLLIARHPSPGPEQQVEAEHDAEDHQEVVVVAPQTPDEHDRIQPDEHDRRDRVTAQQTRALPHEEDRAEADRGENRLNRPERRRHAERDQREGHQREQRAIWA